MTPKPPGIFRILFFGVFFGWNDHWLAYGAPDSQKASSRWRQQLQSELRSLRLVQWVDSLRSAGTARPLDVPRVSREEYAAYNQITREVARRRSWRLIDAHAALPRERLRELFRSDRLHFTQLGLAWLAEQIAAAIRE